MKSHHLIVDSYETGRSSSKLDIIPFTIIYQLSVQLFDTLPYCFSGFFPVPEFNLTRKILFKPIRKAFEIQRKRKIYNGKFSSSDIIKYCKLDESAENFKSHLSLSDREEKNLVKVALTIANMDGREFISLPDIEESYSLINFNLGNLL